MRDVLGWTSAEVADLLETSVAAVNSALQRARATTDESVPTTGPAPAAGDERDLLRRYVQAFANDDVDGLVAILRDDAVLRMPPRPAVIGADLIAGFLRSVAPGGTYAGFHQTSRWANGRPAVTTSILSPTGELVPHAVSVLVVDAGQIVGIETFLDPALAARFEAAVR